MKRLLKATIALGLLAFVTTEASAFTCHAVGRGGAEGWAKSYSEAIARREAVRNCAWHRFGRSCRVVHCTWW